MKSEQTPNGRNKLELDITVCLTTHTGHSPPASSNTLANDSYKILLNL